MIKVWKINILSTGGAIFVRDENIFKVFTYWRGKYNPKRCGVTVEEGVFFTKEQLKAFKKKCKGQK